MPLCRSITPYPQWPEDRPWGCLASGGGRGPLVGVGGPSPANKAARCWCGICKHQCYRTDKQTGVLQKRLSLSVRLGPSAPLGTPAAPGWGRGKGRGGSCPVPCPAAPGAWQSPAAQPPCAARARNAPGQKAIVSHLCPARQLSSELAPLSAQSRRCRVLQPLRLQLSLGELSGPPLLSAAPDAHLTGGQQPAACKVVCPYRVNL